MAKKKDTAPNAPVIVLGLGRFGTAVARSLVHLGHDVLAVDERPEIVQRYASDFTHVVAADTTDTEALRQIGAEQFEVAVVGIGTDIEASVLTVLGLLDLGVKEVWAKAISGKHAAILERVGATHVIRPESQMGKRVAHLVTGTMTDFIEFDDGFAIARTRAPECTVDRTLTDSDVRRKYGVTIVGVKTRGQDFTYAQADTFVTTGDELIVSGPTSKVEEYCALG
ncbi:MULTISPECIES: TrkA family potassium uptake protein [Aeromicrobium]|uniref:Potassium transporter n=1 Tax=Aeromicrobium erythreum TaxID=2041 RepID=A0A0U4CIV3_9ACTN|nr:MULTISPECIES: TrkA family potassium uptake protein [Aeromicrobium]ALX05317.1 potassium transporter [Aeromicrobium erythreum]MCO7240521.1 TrkA family potassium uptake protein [Aeromicrobium sp. CnD17-E]MCX6408714.1 TrkA family potassium uptake protein [Propionibacteriales bacterium]MDR6118967.1 trk system potassium uptake protein TrkA [Aeromicrobium sp. SORGH_AS_0981]